MNRNIIRHSTKHAQPRITSHEKEDSKKHWFKPILMGSNKIISLMSHEYKAKFDNRLRKHSASKNMIQKLNENAIPPYIDR